MCVLRHPVRHPRCRTRGSPAQVRLMSVEKLCLHHPESRCAQCETPTIHRWENGVVGCGEPRSGSSAVIVGSESRDRAPVEAVARAYLPVVELSPHGTYLRVLRWEHGRVTIQAASPLLLCGEAPRSRDRAVTANGPEAGKAAAEGADAYSAGCPAPESVTKASCASDTCGCGIVGRGVFRWGITWPGATREPGTALSPHPRVGRLPHRGRGRALGGGAAGPDDHGRGHKRGHKRAPVGLA